MKEFVQFLEGFLLIEVVICIPASLQASTMFNGRSQITVTSQQSRRQAYVTIIEQPASKAVRFRYVCEGKSAGSIPGASSTPEKKTFPAIKVVGYQGRAVVVVSCVTKDPPYKPHPHNLVGKEGCKRGVCTLEIPPDTMTIHFSNLGIQCVKRKNVEHALRVREEIRVDPFRTGFSHRNQPASIDLNAVRLCFQVFLEGDIAGKFTVPLTSVVSEPIYDKKNLSDLSIIKLSDCVSYVDGGRKDIILLCEKVSKEDVQVRFYDEKSDWEAFADFRPSQVHKQHAIWFRTPRYRNLEVIEPVKVFMQLRRPSDGATSEPLPFELLPLDSEPGILRRKRQKIEDPAHILKNLQDSNYMYVNPAVNKISPRYVDSASPPYMAFESTQVSEYPYSLQLKNPNLPGSSIQPSLWNKATPPTTMLGLPGSSSQSLMWNIPSSRIADTVPPSENLLYLDNQEVNSDEMAATLKTIGAESLPEIENLSFSDILPNQDHNMTDSLTKLANNAIESICQLNHQARG